MKINYKNTALAFLENPKRFPFHTPDEYSVPMTEAEDQELGYNLRMAFAEPGFADLFKNNIQYVTMPFYEAYSKAKDKMKEIVQSEVFEESGTLIIPWPQHTQTIFYIIRASGTQEEWKPEIMMTMFTKYTKSDSHGLDLCIYLVDGDKASLQKDVIWKGFVDQGRDLVWWMVELLLFKTFLRYADVETKIVNAEKRERHLGEKYVNETKSNIEILDSTYFTTISRTEGFGVSGHFRLQPYGPGMQQRRLQWISDYVKHGYTRKAKIIS